MIEKLFVILCNQVRRAPSAPAIDRANLRPGTPRDGLALAVAASWMMVLATASAEKTVTLTWDRSADASVAGYRVYTLEENATTATSVNVLGLNQVTLPGLKEGLRYTFTVTSYNATGVESVPSAAVAFVVPVPLQLLPATTATGPRLLRFPMAQGHGYELQASTDTKVWATVWQTNLVSSYAWTEVQEPPGSTGGNGSGTTTVSQFARRFFRLQVH